MAKLFANSTDPDQMQHSAASGHKDNTGCMKLRSAFEHAQNVQIQHMCKVSCGSLISNQLNFLYMA